MGKWRGIFTANESGKLFNLILEVSYHANTQQFLLFSDNLTGVKLAMLGSKDKEGKKSKRRDTKDAADESASRKKKKKSLLYVLCAACSAIL